MLFNTLNISEEFKVRLVLELGELKKKKKIISCSSEGFRPVVLKVGSWDTQWVCDFLKPTVVTYSAGNYNLPLSKLGIFLLSFYS